MSMACSFGAPCSSAFGLRLLSISLLTHCRQCYGALALAHNRALLRQHLDLSLFFFVNELHNYICIVVTSPIK